MKKYILIKILILAFFFNSCEKNLELTDPSTIPVDQFIVDAQTAEVALLKAYDDLQSRYVSGIEPKATTGLYSDEFDHTGSFPHYTEFLVNNVITNNVGVSRIFSNHYDAITTTIEVIHFTENLSSDVISSSEKEAILAEAHAIQAYSYFQLVQLFGGLPIPDKTVPLSGDAANHVPRATESEVYDHILNEISLAEGKIVDNGKYRFSNNALLVLKAKTQMALSDFGGAETTLSLLIGAYSLEPTYALLFTNANNSEEIFRIRYTSSDGNSLAFFFQPGGRREIAPTQKLLDAFEAGDVRKNLIENNTNASNAYVKKYTDVGSGTDEPYVYRYADVLLMYAEVLARNNDSAAANYLNMVRNRAGLPNISSLNSTNVTDLIAQERYVEFYAENQRWYDVKRLGIASDVINSKTGITFSDKMLLWPIPQDEIDANNEISQADQNPGY